jgi:hypothetical protein
MLLGLGTSTAAQVPTCWGVVIDLIGKVAALQGEDAAREAADDPEGWTRQGNPRRLSQARREINR